MQRSDSCSASRFAHTSARSLDCSHPGKTSECTTPSPLQDISATTAAAAEKENKRFCGQKQEPSTKTCSGSSLQGTVRCKVAECKAEKSGHGWAQRDTKPNRQTPSVRQSLQLRKQTGELNAEGIVCMALETRWCLESNISQFGHFKVLDASHFVNTSWVKLPPWTWKRTALSAAG